MAKGSRRSKYGVEFFWTVVSFAVPFGWTLVTGPGLWQVIVGWTLWLVSFSLAVHLFWRWATDKHRPRARLIVPLCAAAVFAVVGARSICAGAHPTYMYFVPGLILSDGVTRAYGLQFRGDDPLFNVDASTTDADALAVARGSNGGRPDLWDRYWNKAFFQATEVDPRHRGLVTWLTYRPFKPPNETLELQITSREIDVSELTRVYQSGAYQLPAYYMKITNQRNRRVLAECISDPQFSLYDPSTSSLPLCCDDIDPKEGVFSSCAPFHVRAQRYLACRASGIYRLALASK